MIVEIDRPNKMVLLGWLRKSLVKKLVGLMSEKTDFGVRCLRLVCTD